MILAGENKRTEPPLKKIEIHTEDRQTLNVAVMSFTKQEAHDLLERFKAEKEEEERREAQRRAAAEAARHGSMGAYQNAVYSAAYFRHHGRLSWGGWSWTYYSERILPGHGLRIPGRHTDGMGYVRDGSGFLCLASDALRKGTVIETPFGSYGKIYDCGCGYSTIDVYVNW